MSSEKKRKTAMVLHQLEESLGKFVISSGDLELISAEKLETIHQREADKGKFFNKESIKDIVEATYLDELFGFALDITAESSLGDSVKYLYSMFHQLDIYEVRNAVSHPNRPFWDCYWYRVAAIASDPVNEVLGLTEVRSAFASAEAGVIQDPPEEWIRKIIWEIPNNLPDQFDHEVTGLIGRSKELQELKKYVSNPRVNTIALVAPGGTGKTALALDLLNGIVSTPSFTRHISSVIYVTMKTEKLTHKGTIQLDSIETIGELKDALLYAINSIYEEDLTEYSEAVQEHESDKIFVCIDNLETLLRDSHEDFEKFNHALPPLWKVLLTSRVSISNATIMPIDMLKEKSAIHLARSYLAKRGGPKLEERALANLAGGCFYNPLAIRLTIDLIKTGKDVPSSMNVANKEIAEFSYNNLIDALSETAIEILEAIFVEDRSTRLSLCELLGSNLDEISSAIGELSQTSLLTRASTDQGEVYSLSDSVRDLLVVSPRSIAIRTTVQEKIQRRRTLSAAIDTKQERDDIPVWHNEYIPRDTGENLKILVTQVNAALRKSRKNRERAVEFFRLLKDSEFMYGGQALYHRCLARILEVLADFRNAEEHYKMALAIEPDDPATQYLLARLYHSIKRFEDAGVLNKKLIDSGWARDEDGYIEFGRSIYLGYFLSLLFQDKYEEIFEETKKWKESGSYRGVIGTFRAGAWKKKMEGLVEKDPQATVDALVRSSKILNEIFRTEGYFGTANIQAIKVFGEIEFCFSRREYQVKYPEEMRELFSFIAGNVTEIERVQRSFDKSNLVLKLSQIDASQAVFKDMVEDPPPALGSFIDSDDARDARRGLVTVSVTNRPRDKASFLFAKDNSGNDYFLHFDNCRDGIWRDWSRISIGAKIDIVPDEKDEQSEKAINAKEVYIHLE